MKNIRDAIEVFFFELGFSSARDYFYTTLGLKGTVSMTAWQALAAFLLALVSFVSEWIWNPPIAFFLLLMVIIMDAWYGYRVAVQIKGERFSWRKGYRTFSIITAHTLQLFFFYNITTKVYPSAVFVAHGVFIYILTFKTKSWMQHLVLLKLQEKGIMGFIMKLITSKFGADIVETINRNYDSRKQKSKPKEEENENA